MYFVDKTAYKLSLSNGSANVLSTYTLKSICYLH